MLNTGRGYIMQKTADKMRWRDQLREMTNISGKAAERFFSPELKRVMDILRNNDDQIRANVVGSTIGNASPIEGAAPLKELFKSAKSNLNRREYMSAVSDLSRFHKQMAAVDASIKNLDMAVDKIHDEFLTSGLKDDQKKYLREMRERFGPKEAASGTNDLVKIAGLSDFLYNVLNRRGRALAMWEKKYPRAADQLKKDTRALVDESGKLLDVTNSALKAMGTARAHRAVDDYISASNEIKKKYVNYDKLFRDAYARSYKKFIEQMGEIQQAPAAPVTDSKELQEKTVTIPTTFGPGIKTDVPEGVQAPELNLPAKPAPAPTVSKSPTEETLDKLEQMQQSAPVPQQLPLQFKVPAQPAPIRPPIAPTPLKVAPEPLEATTHRKFYETLEAMSNESPLVLASFIKKYAASIKSSDPETAVQLLSIVKSIRG